MTTIEISLSPEQYFNSALLHEEVSRHANIPSCDISHIEIKRRSLDSRRGIRYITRIDIYTHNDTYSATDYSSPYTDCHNAPPVVIVGAGPAGLFAALHALECGIKPIIVERGKAVETRKKDISMMVRNRLVNSGSNWCYGEGGAGTFSDGKLYTRSTKRGNVNDILRKFVEHGANSDIMIDAHAHIGTDRLGGIIARMRKTILDYGGEYHFDSKVEDFIIHEGRVCGVKCSGGDTFEGIATILATGHSARDIYSLFLQRGWLLEAKPFAIGLRIEHPQQLIDNIQYHSKNHSPLLPPASYSLTTQIDGHGVFSFCMCPGGVIVPASTSDGEQVVNGMSNASRSSAFANSGIAVTVSPSDIPEYAQFGPLSMLRFQQDVERRAYESAGGKLNAPTQRLTDFCEGKSAQYLNKSNYMGDCVGVELNGILPKFVSQCLQKAFPVFGKKMHGYYTSEASLLAVESRTSSPVRIPRCANGEHPQLKGLFPCGEGAGYAGGIISSAIDGVKQVDNITMMLNRL